MVTDEEDCDIAVEAADEGWGTTGVTVSEEGFLEGEALWALTGRVWASTGAIAL